MSRASAPMRELATRLIAHETESKTSSNTKAPAAFPVIAKLRPELANLMGQTGFSTLVSRALALAKAEVPWTGKVQAQPDGALQGLEELAKQVGPDDFFEGSVVVLALLLELLATFIGEKLTLQLLSEIWPELPVNDLHISKRDKNAKAN